MNWPLPTVATLTGIALPSESVATSVPVQFVVLTQTVRIRALVSAGTVNLNPLPTVVNCEAFVAVADGVGTPFVHVNVYDGTPAVCVDPAAVRFTISPSLE